MKWADRLTSKQFHLMFVVATILGLTVLVISGYRLDAIRTEQMHRWFAEHGYEDPSRIPGPRRTCDEWLVTHKDGGTVHRFRDCRRGDPELVW